MATIQSDKLIRNKLEAGRRSPLATYRALTVGDMSGIRFVFYELLTMFVAPLPGGLGFLLRKKLYPMFLGRSGSGLIIGRNVTLRHPQRIHLGNNVTIDDGCIVDGRGTVSDQSADGGVVLEDGVMINRNCMVLAKNGPVRIGERTTIGANSVIVSMSGVEIGHSVMFAGGCYISAGAYRVDGSHGPLMDQEVYSDGPIKIGAGAWLGTSAVVLDGASVGDGTVIGAGAVVNDSIAEHVIALGVPAKVIRERRS